MAKKATYTPDRRHRISKILWTVYCLFLIASLVVIGKIVYLQAIWEPDRKSLEYFTPSNRKESVKPERGTITDCNGRLLESLVKIIRKPLSCL